METAIIHSSATVDSFTSRYDDDDSFIFSRDPYCTYEYSFIDDQRISCTVVRGASSRYDTRTVQYE
jgi:hypothetical protein